MRAFRKLWTIAYRDLGRNRRRTIFSIAAVALGLAQILMMSGFIEGVTEGSLQSSIQLNTGHVQIQAESYDESRASLLWSDLLEDSAAWKEWAESLDKVKSAAPVLWAGGVLNTSEETVSLSVNGIDPTSAFHDPLREGLVAGEYLTPEDRGMILMGKRLADDLGVGVGKRVSLVAAQSEGDPLEGVFTIKGLFATEVPSFDNNQIFMPLDQAGSFFGSGDRTSAIILMLYDQDDADRVAEALATPGITIRTWEEMHAVLFEILKVGLNFYYLMYGIVIMVVAVIIMNTLLMAVFERMREIGILSALGMRARQIMTMMMLEAATLALVGIIIGLVLGLAIIGVLSITGIPIGEASASVVDSISVGTTLYTDFAPTQIAAISLAMLIIILLVSLYPAIYAARLEPVAALRDQ